ncbi:hypothetical protein QBC46DRAFT_349761 [Diplogelasinospora grovesii]|uniref:Centromere protein Scm3 n=1 Tax=Diplogelasinospora grovesii TaxID=303347 RepID=A0AAN6NJY1_9PEZI|nr:hypothetical protein QBC46DRAFT_349761 [Diplogelasinospora grovesii]
MERPSKRARTGPSPLEDEDAESDELNLQPEELNLRRDPGYQFERSRAFAAFKLKSAFERIFEKYEKDFTGVGDEIDLATGEIVVDNGHIQSLKEANDDDASQDGSVDEEEEQGAQDKSTGNSIRPPMSAPNAPVFSGGPSNATPYMGGPPPQLSGMMPTSYMQPAPPSMLYGAPSDQAWAVPEIPQVPVETRISPKTAKLRVIASRDGDGDGEDDVLLEKSTAELATPKTDEKRRTQRLSLPQSSALKDRTTAKDGNKGSAKKAKEKTPKQRTPKSQQVAEVQTSSSSVRRSRKLKVDRAQIRQDENQPPATVTSLAVDAPTEKPVSNHKAKIAVESRNGATGGKEEIMAVKAKRKKRDSTGSKHLPDDFYISSSPSRRVIVKPSGQRLQVEIAVKQSVEFTTFRAITPEASVEHSAPEVPNVEQAEHTTNAASQVIENRAVKDSGDADKTGSSTDETENRSEAAPPEVFTRNVVDPAYAFSDEDEPIIPRPSKAVKQQDMSGSRRPSTRRTGAIHMENPEGTVQPTQVVPNEDKAAQDQEVNTSPPPRQPSPTVDVSMADAENSPSGDVADTVVLPLVEEAEAEHQGEKQQQQSNPQDQDGDIIMALDAIISKLAPTTSSENSSEAVEDTTKQDTVPPPSEGAEQTTGGETTHGGNSPSLLKKSPLRTGAARKPVLDDTASEPKISYLKQRPRRSLRFLLPDTSLDSDPVFPGQDGSTGRQGTGDQISTGLPNSSWPDEATPWQTGHVDLCSEVSEIAALLKKRPRRRSTRLQREVSPPAENTPTLQTDPSLVTREGGTTVQQHNERPSSPMIPDSDPPVPQESAQHREKEPSPMIPDPDPPVPGQESAVQREPSPTIPDSDPPVPEAQTGDGSYQLELPTTPIRHKRLRQPQHHTTPHKQTPRQTPSRQTAPSSATSKRTGILSLLSDDDEEEDELSLGPGDFTPSGTRWLPRKTTTSVMGSSPAAAAAAAAARSGSGLRAGGFNGRAIHSSQFLTGDILLFAPVVVCQR